MGGWQSTWAGRGRRGRGPEVYCVCGRSLGHPGLRGRPVILGAHQVRPSADQTI